MKQNCCGLTLIEILLSLTILSLILSLLIPQLLKYTHDQAVDKTVAEMNQIVVAARNYYQDKQESMTSTLSNASYWPQTLSDLTTNSYLPPAALCSSWPLMSAVAGTTCNNHQPYVLFPSTDPSSTAGRYDTSVVGIASGAYGKGGNFWGVSVTLPNAKVAEEVRQKLPFGTRCSITDLRNSVPCTVTDANTTVTALTPRPAVFAKSPYSKEGLIQSMGSIKVCDGNCGTTNAATITMPSNCDAGQTPVLFVYPFGFAWINPSPPPSSSSPSSFPGISLKTVRNLSSWTVTAGESGKNSSKKAANFSSIYLAYLTVCASGTDPNKWDPSWFPGD